MNENNQRILRFLQLMHSPLKSRLFLFSNLPSAFFSGVKIQHVDLKMAVVTVPYKWFSKNPFRSTYFACLAMAAELSTGVLAMMQVFERKPNVSMLVTKLEANYYKKAVGITTFVCADGKAFSDIVQEAINSGQPQVFTAKSIGKNNAGELVAEFFITWSFKAKS